MARGLPESQWLWGKSQGGGLAEALCNCGGRCVTAGPRRTFRLFPLGHLQTPVGGLQALSETARNAGDRWVGSASLNAEGCWSRRGSARLWPWEPQPPCLSRGAGSYTVR